MRNEKKTILVVDDDNASSYICGTFLSGEYRIISAAGGREALRIVEAEKVDLILLDLEMPVFDGFATYDELKKSMKGLQIPVIFVTGKGDKKTVLKCKSKGAEGFIVKPIRRDILLGKIREAFSNQEYMFSRKKVLVIDDSVDYLKRMKLYLKDHYEVMTISTTRTAIEYLRNHQPDVILVDYYMPLYNGGDVIRILKNSNLAPDAVVFLVSGSMDRAILNECATAGIDGALSKEASREEILDRLEAALAKKKTWTGKDGWI